jgi:uncharacterized protein YjdB
LLVPGETLQLQAITRDAAGLAVAGVMISWTSSDRAVAQVTSTGIATAVGEGPSTITAAALTVSNSAEITVTEGSISDDVEFESI